MFNSAGGNYWGGRTLSGSNTNEESKTDALNEGQEEPKLDPPPNNDGPPKPQWKSVLDSETGRYYYYHRKTKITTWIKPKNFDADRKAYKKWKKAKLKSACTAEKASQPATTTSAGLAVEPISKGSGKLPPGTPPRVPAATSTQQREVFTATTSSITAKEKEVPSSSPSRGRNHFSSSASLASSSLASASLASTLTSCSRIPSRPRHGLDGSPHVNRERSLMSQRKMGSSGRGYMIYQTVSGDFSTPSRPNRQGHEVVLSPSPPQQTPSSAVDKPAMTTPNRREPSNTSSPSLERRIASVKKKTLTERGQEIKKQSNVPPATSCKPAGVKQPKKSPAQKQEPIVSTTRSSTPKKKSLPVIQRRDVSTTTNTKKKSSSSPVRRRRRREPTPTKKTVSKKKKSKEKSHVISYVVASEDQEVQLKPAILKKRSSSGKHNKMPNGIPTSLTIPLFKKRNSRGARSLNRDLVEIDDDAISISTPSTLSHESVHDLMMRLTDEDEDFPDDERSWENAISDSLWNFCQMMDKVDPCALENTCLGAAAAGGGDGESIKKSSVEASGEEEERDEGENKEHNAAGTVQLSTMRCGW